MKVFVVMGNDFPDNVFEDEEEAKRYCENKMQAKENKTKFGTSRIYWRPCEFELIKRGGRK